MSIVGFSGHGKTVYLASLLHVIQRYLPEYWPGFFRQGLDMFTIDTVRSNLQCLENFELPSKTRRNFPRPCLQLFSKMHKYNNREVIFYDPPGEAFEVDADVEKYASFVKQAKTVLFIVSLKDLPDPLPSEMHRLLEIYTIGMARLKANMSKQHLVVVFTKADDLQDERYFGKFPDILQYLESSERANLNDLDKYLTNMRIISRNLQYIVRNHLRAEPFVNLANASFKSVNYSVVSALGCPPNGDKLSEAMRPKRVIDPFLWVLENK
jgi:hypothetical protein